MRSTTVIQHNLSDLPDILKLAGRQAPKNGMSLCLCPRDEETLQFIYNASRTSPIPIKMTCAPQYMRVITQRQKSEAIQLAAQGGRHSGGRGCMSGNGFCFISHVGEVFGCGFLPIPAGNIRQQSFKQIYQQSPLFLELRNHVLLRGKCGACGYKTICGGCRARALSIHKSHLEEEPYCVYSTN